MATSWAPLLADQPDAFAAAQRSVIGFRVRLLETAGKTVRVTVSSLRPVVAASEVDFRGKPLVDCRVTDGKIQLEMSAYQWSEVEAKW